MKVSSYKCPGGISIFLKNNTDVFRLNCNNHLTMNFFVGLGFSHLGFWSGNLFLIAPFPDLCLVLVPF